MKHTLLITCLASVLVPSVLAMAQSFEVAQAYESFKPYGDIIPSVESFSMAKYGKVSPSLYSGTVVFHRVCPEPIPGRRSRATGAYY